jgi:hypothetical protein
VLNEKVVFIDVSNGVIPIVKDFEQFCFEYEIEMVIVLDVGGDIIARGGKDLKEMALARYSEEDSDTEEEDICYEEFKKRIPPFDQVSSPSGGNNPVEATP